MADHTNVKASLWLAWDSARELYVHPSSLNSVPCHPPYSLLLIEKTVHQQSFFLLCLYHHKVSKPTVHHSCVTPSCWGSFFFTHLQIRNWHSLILDVSHLMPGNNTRTCVQMQTWRGEEPLWPSTEAQWEALQLLLLWQLYSNYILPCFKMFTAAISKKHQNIMWIW